jgi:hypothetical protein
VIHIYIYIYDISSLRVNIRLVPNLSFTKMVHFDFIHTGYSKTEQSALSNLDNIRNSFISQLVTWNKMKDRRGTSSGVRFRVILRCAQLNFTFIYFILVKLTDF